MSRCIERIGMGMTATPRQDPHTACGVIVHPSATLAPEVIPGRIAAGVEIFPGTRIAGATTSIGPGCRIGREAPATLIDCQLGHDVAFHGGFAEQAVLLDGVRVGSSAHFRPGTILEENASCGHSVGLKQTLLMPWVTAGSLVNFCDCLMAGGTGPGDHGEIGSSYVHFNFTPRQDKATASLIGNVPEGVLLDQPPVFLGGHGGLVGPVHIAFGTTVAAGVVLRRDIAEPGLLIRDDPAPAMATRPYDRTRYADVDRVCGHTFRYVGNLHALAAWYRHVRMPFLADDPFAAASHEGVLIQLAMIARERCRQLDCVAAGIASRPGPYPSHARLLALRDRLPDILNLPAASPQPPDTLTTALDYTARDHLHRIQRLSAAAKQTAVNWLRTLVQACCRYWSDEKYE